MDQHASSPVRRGRSRRHRCAPRSGSERGGPSGRSRLTVRAAPAATRAGRREVARRPSRAAAAGKCPPPVSSRGRALRARRRTARKRHPRRARSRQRARERPASTGRARPPPASRSRRRFPRSVPREPAGGDERWSSGERARQGGENACRHHSSVIGAGTARRPATSTRSLREFRTVWSPDGRWSSVGFGRQVAGNPASRPLGSAPATTARCPGVAAGENLGSR